MDKLDQVVTEIHTELEEWADRLRTQNQQDDTPDPYFEIQELVVGDLPIFSVKPKQHSQMRPKSLTTAAPKSLNSHQLKMLSA